MTYIYIEYVYVIMYIYICIMFSINHPIIGVLNFDLDPCTNAQYDHMMEYYV